MIYFPTTLGESELVNEWAQWSMRVKQVGLSKRMSERWERMSEASREEPANEWAVQANKWMDEQVAQCLCLDFGCSAP